MEAIKAPREGSEETRGCVSINFMMMGVLLLKEGRTEGRGGGNALSEGKEETR